MITEVWFQHLGDDAETLKFTDVDNNSTAIVVPSIGEMVGIRQVFPDLPDDPHYKLDYVVDVRHYFFKVANDWKQEIHVMYSSRP
jgi:hypothetical protein